MSDDSRTYFRFAGTAAELRRRNRPHVTDALAYALAAPPTRPALREPIHDGTFFTLDHPRVMDGGLAIRIGSTADEGDIEVPRAAVEELHAALGKWLHDTIPLAELERREVTLRGGYALREGYTATASVCVHCDQIVPIGQDYHQCPVRGKVRLR